MVLTNKFLMNMRHYLSALHTICSNDIGSILVCPSELFIDGLRSAADSKSAAANILILFLLALQLEL